MLPQFNMGDRVEIYNTTDKRVDGLIVEVVGKAAQMQDNIYYIVRYPHLLNGWECGNFSNACLRKVERVQM